MRDPGKGDGGQPDAGRRQRLGTLALATAVAGLWLGVWAMVADVPIFSFPRPATIGLESYLDFTLPALQEVARAAHDGTSLRLGLATFFRAHVPDPKTIWQTQKPMGDSQAQALWLDGRKIALPGFAPWSVPENPTWAEDPHSNLSWEFYYHSLGWLRAPAALLSSTGDERYAQQILRYVLGWIAENPLENPPSAGSWYDHAVAYRSDTLVYLLPILARTATFDQFQLILRSLYEHGRVLRGYLTDTRFAGSNHNMFHALSLYSLASALPELRGARAWRTEARRRISSLLGEMVHKDEGVSTEQASSYHYLALNLFVAADQYLRQQGNALSSDDRAVLSRMVEWGALLSDPDGTLPAMGDTPAGAVAPLDQLRRLEREGFLTPVSLFVLSEGKGGTRPPDAIFKPTSGYAIMRPSYGDSGPWSQDLHLLVDMSPVLHSHGHRDAMNVLLSAGGSPLLVDSGGPFVNADPRHADFVATRAHNTVVVDGADQNNGPVSMTFTRDTPTYSAVSGEHSLYPGVTHQRLVVLLKPGTLVIIDRLTATDGGTHRYDLLYHLPPDAAVATGRSSTRVEVSSGAGMTLAVQSSGSMSMDVAKGQQNPALGWVTNAYLHQEPAPVLEFTMNARDAWFMTVIAPSRGAAVPLPQFQASESGSYLHARVDLPEQSWRIDVPRGADPAVSPIPSG